MAVSSTSTLIHDPNDILDYSLDWSSVLASGETISTSLWTVQDGTATLGNSAGDTGATSKAGTISSGTTTVWVLTASPGVVTLRQRIVTSASRQYDRTLRLAVEHQ